MPNQQSGNARPYTSLIGLNGSFEIPMKDVQKKVRRTSSMIVHVGEASGQTSKAGGPQPRDGETGTGSKGQKTK